MGREQKEISSSPLLKKVDRSNMPANFARPLSKASDAPFLWLFQLIAPSKRQQSIDSNSHKKGDPCWYSNERICVMVKMHDAIAVKTLRLAVVLSEISGSTWFLRIIRFSK